MGDAVVNYTLEMEQRSSNRHETKVPSVSLFLSLTYSFSLYLFFSHSPSLCLSGLVQGRQDVLPRVYFLVLSVAPSLSLSLLLSHSLIFSTSLSFSLFLSLSLTPSLCLSDFVRGRHDAVPRVYFLVLSVSPSLSLSLCFSFSLTRSLPFFLSYSLSLSLRFCMRATRCSTSCVAWLPARRTASASNCRHARMSHVMRMNESLHTQERVMAHT